MVSISTIVLGVIILFAILNYNNTINAATSMLDRFDNFFRMPNDERTQTNNDDNIMKIDLSETYTYMIENGKIVDSIGNKNEDIEQYVYKAYKQNKEKGSTVLQVSNEGEEIPKKEREKIAYELLTEFGIDDLEKKHVSQMSGGEQQRIAIMRAIINKPQILLADEPTGNLDKENSQTIMNLFERLNKQGMTIVMVTHDTSLAKYGTRVVRVEDGRIIEKGKEILK